MDLEQAQSAMEISDYERDIERGLRFVNVLLEGTQSDRVEMQARIEALARLLLEKGIITREEMKEPLRRALAEARQTPRPRVRLHKLVGDKYTAGRAADIDCASLIPLCQARCCTFTFWFSKQDLHERIARWDYGNPYWIRQNADGYCVHYDRAACNCTIHGQRPHVCRMYDCRQDKRVWVDYENRIPADWTPRQGNAAPGFEEIANRGGIEAAIKSLQGAEQAKSA